MQVRIIAVGKIKERFLSDGIAEYEKRLVPYLKLSITEIAEERRGVHASASQEQHAKEKEGERILAAIPEGTYVVVLDIRGTELASEALAARLRSLQLAGTPSVTVIIGGDLGLSDAVLGRAALRLSLSPMTFTHQMARLILMEQLYRACRINSGEPYHK
ncbi:23S rRNA (pseudouridine(1915)-N(3))-methyltransferase RlmH [Methanoregula sp.]|uniref:23S rRNA (pseudouridine(1915)-N(3))-methyltransferase RlmH n=1 Tax=Methanoregula sp. TaxID=2052170 RepID=UPI002C28D2D5|nr:23S rRNA (pseudouridine(1915)-N(3))-methyltransferase RlmH [Methanoregula sp.]HVP95620.1 23S rRNA (pseudouridine(1915)-N(3))-methyltransferase RlmH [Methanoregula sp.]